MSSWREDSSSKAIHIRMVVVLSFLLLGLCAVVGRVYYLQAIAHDELVERQSPVDRSVTFTPRRGSILDRNGTELAVTVKAPSVHVRPRAIPDDRRAEVGAALSSILDIDREKVMGRLNPKRRFAWIKRQISPELAKKIEDLELPGVAITQEHKRYYPQESLAGQILGFVGIDGNGLEGLERSLEATLAGSKSKVVGQRDARGRVIMSGQIPKFETFEGHTVELTIDERIQRVAQDALQEQVDKYSAKGGYAVVLDVKTGEILAMANTPEFDPNKFREYKSKDWRLRPVTDTFEPGSVVKPLVLASALQEKTVNLDTRFDCEGGRIKIGRYTIRDSHAHDVLNSAEVVQVSSNICAYKIAQTIGKEQTYDYLRAFGFGARTELGVRGEQPGLVWPPDRWAEVSFANIAFGQGFTATPLQVTTSIGSIANGGMLMRPRLIKRVIDRDGNVVKQPTPQLVRQIVSPEVARQTAYAMSLVTREGGTAKQAAMKDFTVAGKTGTAQKVNPETRRYDSKMWVASFVGFLPAERPEIAIAVMVDEPQRIHYGGVVAAPAFKKIALEAVHVLGILPVPATKRFHKPSQDEVAVIAEVVEDDEQVFDLGVTLLEDSTPAPRRDDGGQTVPDLMGLTARQAILRARKVGALPEVHGWGRVVAQRPEAGQSLADGERIVIDLLPPSQETMIADEPAAGAVQ